MASSRTLQSPILVGRDAALVAFERALAEAGVGRGGAILVAGEAGIGKSRVLGALRRQATANGFRAAVGRLEPQDQLVPLAAIRDFARATAAGSALLGDLAPRSAGSNADALASRRILVHEAADRIEATIHGPNLFAFEDLHWADELSLEVIGELARRAVDRPLIVVATYRPEELPRGSIHREWRSRLLTQRLAVEIQLERLTADETAQMTSLILGTGMPAPTDVSEAVHARTNGIPLHIEELLAAIDDPTSGRAIRDAAVPSTIEDAVVARLARCSDDAQSVARAGAVLGRSFAPDVVAGVMGRPLHELDGPFEELVGAGILLPFQRVDHGDYDFRHQLLRDAVYHSASPSDLRRLHARAAEFGSKLAGATDIHASVHYERAGLRAQAFAAARAAADAAAAVTSRFESFELYRRAIANLPEDMPPGEAGDVWAAYAGAGFSVDDVPAAEEATHQARRLYVEAGRPLEAATTLIDLGSLCRRDVRPRTERRQFLDAAEAELAAVPDSVDRIGSLIYLRTMQAVLDLDVANLEEARRRLGEARELSLRPEVDAVTAEMYRLDIEHMLAWADVLAGRVDQLQRMLDMSREARDANLEGTGVTNYRITGDIAARVMEYPTSSIGVTEGIRYADAVEQSYCRHVMSATTAIMAWAEGRWDDAVHTAELELVERGSRRGSIGSRAVLGFVALGRGDVERARTLLSASLAITRPSGEVDLVLPALWGEAETALVDGDPARALDHCWEAIELAEPTGERALLVPFVVTGVRAALLERRPELAQKWLDRITPMLLAWPDLARPALEHAAGLVKLASGSIVAARASLETAAAGWEARGRIWETTWARLDLAAALLRANRYGEAAPVLDAVIGVARRLGSLPLLRRAEELQRSSRAHASGQEPWHPLTVREFEVARKIAEGLTNAAIAEELFVSPKTVSAHVEHILDKLGVARRAEVAAWVATIAATVA